MMIQKRTYFRRVLFFAIAATLIMGSVCAQDVESETVRIRINNLPDKNPPVIKLLTPAIIGDNIFSSPTEEIDLIGEANDESGIKFVSVNSDIRSINEAGLFSTRLKLNPGVNRIRLMASDNLDNVQEQYILVQYLPPVETLADKIVEKSKYYALIIGIDKYNARDLEDLDNPINDAEKLKTALLTHYTFEEEHINLIKNAKRDDIVLALDGLASTVTPNDNVLIFYAGHGHWDERANVGYWLPSDASLNNSTKWFRNSTLVDYLKTIDSRHTLLITDACFAGSIFTTRGGFPREDRAYEVLYELPSRKAMTSGRLHEVPDRSSFTRYLLDRLEENQNTYISSEELFSSFRIAVINNSDAIPQYGEIKNVGDEGGDFIFLRKK